MEKSWNEAAQVHQEGSRLSYSFVEIIGCKNEKGLLLLVKSHIPGKECKKYN